MSRKKDPTKWVTQTCTNCGNEFETRKIYVDRGQMKNHIDCNKLNNRRDNLLVCTDSYHCSLHAKMKRLEVGQCLS